MNRGLTLGTRTKLIAGALALVLAGLTHASGTQVGGGATLPSIGYVGSNAASNLQVWDGTGSTATIATGSLFGQYIAQSGNPNVSYCLTGSGAGKDVLAGPITLTVNGVVTTFNVQNACQKNSVGTVPGFGAGLTGVNRSDLTQPDFAAADSPLSAGDISNYHTGHGSTAWPTEFPAVAGAIAIAFNLTDDQGTKVTAANFTDAQICSIFSGAVTNWSDSSLSGALTLTSGHTVNQKINVVYRSDGSGTTFSFANHLANVCSGTASAHFVTDQTFTNVVAKFEPSIPSNWVGASGNAAVANGIQGNGASIGYVETANALQTNPTISIAKVGGLSPTANFNNKLTINLADIAYNSVINGADATTGVAVVQALSSPPSTQCIALVQPSHYATPGTIVPTGSYPIVAISYLMGNAQGNGTDLTNARNLLEAPYNATIQAGVTTIGGSTGLQFLTPGRGSFTAAQVGACLAN